MRGASAGCRYFGYQYAQSWRNRGCGAHPTSCSKITNRFSESAQFRNHGGSCPCYWRTRLCDEILSVKRPHSCGEGCCGGQEICQQAGLAGVGTIDRVIKVLGLWELPIQAPHHAMEEGIPLLPVGADRFSCFGFGSFSLSSKRRSISFTMASLFSVSFSWQVSSVNCSQSSRFGST